jgi:LCP family protein required for cell wall assembly
MSTDPQALKWQQEAPPRRPLSFGARITLTVAFLLFVAGGILFGYIFFSAIGDRLDQPLNPVSAAVPILPDNNSSAPVTNTSPATSANPVVAAPTDKDRVTILLLGIDQRESEAGQPTRTDTMILLTVDPVGKTMGILTIPRDLWVPIPGLSKPLDERINTAHFYGDFYKYPGGGPVLAKKTVQYNLGIPVNYYVRIDFKGFEKIVDALGGVNINVEKDIRDNEYPDGNYGVISLYIPAGQQHMNGETALQFVRTRHSDSDFGRTRRQLQFLLAMRDQALKLNILPKVPTLISQFRDSVKTDLSASEILSLARIASQIDSDHIIARSIDETMVSSWMTPQGGDVLIPKRDAIKAVVNEMFGAAAQPTAAPAAAPTARPTTQPTPVQNAQTRSRLVSEGARIEVLNGTTTKGFAGRAQVYLNGLGYNVLKIGDAGRYDYTETVILYYATKPVAQASLAQLLNVRPENVRQSPTARTDVDIRVILGANAVVP